MTERPRPRQREYESISPYRERFEAVGKIGVFEFPDYVRREYEKRTGEKLADVTREREPDEIREDALRLAELKEERILLRQQERFEKPFAEEDAAEHDPFGLGARRAERLLEIQAEMEKLVADPRVREMWHESANEETRVASAARRIQGLRQLSEHLNQDAEYLTLQRSQRGSALSSVDEEFISSVRAEQRRIAQEIAELERVKGVPERLAQLELLDIRKNLDEYGFAEIEPYRSIIRDVVPKLRAGKPLMLLGETGVGKSAMAQYIAERYLGREPEIFAGEEEANAYKLIGKTGLKKGETAFLYGPLARALKEGKPLIEDEVDAIPHALLIRQNPILDAKRGQKIRLQEDTGEEFEIPDHFVVIGTGNRKSRRYERHELDPAFLDRFANGAGVIEVSYPDLGKKGPDGELLAPELEKLALAIMIDHRGMINHGAEVDFQQDVLPQLERFLRATREVHEVFTGQEKFMGRGAVASTGEGAVLKKGTISLRAFRGIVEAWRNDYFRSSIDDHALTVIRSQSDPEDRLLMFEIFAHQGFFRGKTLEEIRIPQLTQEQLSAWTS